MNLPSIAVKISGNDGADGTDWKREFVIHAPSLTTAEAPRLLADAEGAASLLLVWTKYLREFIGLGMTDAARERHRDERADIA